MTDHDNDNPQAGKGAAPRRVLTLCGGIGGAKLALGLYRVLPADSLTLAVNTGDDFTHLGFHISPDIDTVLYTLAGLADQARGWGRAEESWQFMAALEELGGETWFSLGDKDLALHAMRTERLRHGESLSAVTRDLAKTFKLAADILPASDSPVRTVVVAGDERLSFQEYFVRRKWQPVATNIVFDGAKQARLQPELLAGLEAGAFDAVVIAPSNPYLSIDPMLAIPGFKDALSASTAPVIAVSPIVKGDAVKGPTAKLMKELGGNATPIAIVEHYRDLLDGFVIDEQDAALAGDIAGAAGVPVRVAQTVMTSLDDRDHLARAVLAFGDDLASKEDVGKAVRKKVS